MVRNSIALLLLLSISTFTLAADAPADWAKHSFKASPETVYLAAYKAIAQHHEIKSSDKDLHIIAFHIGATAMSWGYTMVLSVEPQQDGTSIATVAIQKAGGPALSWGSGKKETEKVFKWTDQNLQSATAKN